MACVLVKHKIVRSDLLVSFSSYLVRVLLKLLVQILSMLEHHIAGEGRAADRALHLVVEPVDEVLVVEAVADIARQRCHHVAMLEVCEAD